MMTFVVLALIAVYAAGVYYALRASGAIDVWRFRRFMSRG